MEERVNKGDLVVSIMGHDKGRNYLVLEVLGEFAMCVDGEYRLLENPKKKRLKHLKKLFVSFEDLIKKYDDKKLYDFEVKTRIKNEVKMHKD